MINNSREFLQRFPALSAIDFFFARGVCGQSLLQSSDEVDKQCFYAMCALSWMLRQGHSCLPLDALAGATFWRQSEQQNSGFTFTSSDKLLLVLARFKASEQQPVVFENNQLYLRRYWNFENEVATIIREKITIERIKSKLSEQQIATKLDVLFPTGENYPDWQKIAVANSLGYRFSIISGGPGTGKTYTASRMLIMLQLYLQSESSLKIALAAPTGKAANRLIESINLDRQQLNHLTWVEPYLKQIPQQAKTLHRLLAMGVQQNKPRYSRQNPLPYDIILLDEASMIDLPNMCRLLRALPSHATLILLGDAEQLPSVETGNILADLANHQGFSPTDIQWLHTVLNDSQRLKQDETLRHHQYCQYLLHSQRFGGNIAKLAKLVKERDELGSFQLLEQHPAQSSLFANWDEIAWTPRLQSEQLLKQLVEHFYLPVTQLDTPQQALSQLSNFRILTPFRETEYGVKRLNHKIECLLNKANHSIKVAQNYHARPILITQNSYETGLFNGDIGILWQSDREQPLFAYFESEQGICAYSLEQLPQYETVYAMTIHKAQGSEFKQLAIFLEDNVDASLCNQAMIYTAITRAKEKLLMITDESSWKKALLNEVQRYSGLKDKLQS